MLTDVTLVQWLLIASIMFAALVVRGMSGFGASVVATPFLAMVLPIHQAVTFVSPLMWLTFLTLAVRDRHAILWREIVRLLLPTAIGVAAGLYLFNRLDHVLLMKGFGAFVVAYAVYIVLGEVRGTSRSPCSPRWAFPAGLAGSFLDTLFGGGGGPAAVVYLHARQVARDAFRATVVALWLVESSGRVAGYAYSGYYASQGAWIFASMLPVMWAGNWVGERIHAGIDRATFGRVIAGVLAVSGVTLLLK
jgi:uncharacterized membrane protein YfcA